MARSAHQDTGGPRTPRGGQDRAAHRQQRVAQRTAVVLTAEGYRQLAARAAWLETRQIPELAEGMVDPDHSGWADGQHGRALTELSRLRSILGQAITTDQLPPERSDVVELGDEVVVELAAGDTERFLLVDPVEAPLDQLRISVESPLAQAVLGRRVGEQVEVQAPAGRYQCRILATRRFPASPAEDRRTT
jgi:transcription elongation factor GreA